MSALAAVTPSSRRSYRGWRNLVPLPYRNVSMQPYDGTFTEEAPITHLLGREAYRRTEFIVLHDQASAMAVVAIAKRNNEALFSEIVDVEILAMPSECSFTRSPETDCSNRSALAELAYQHGVRRTLVVWGRYDHVDFIHRPDPLLVRVIEVAPPEPPELYDLVRRVLSYAVLPPVHLELERIELRDLCSKVKPKAFLVPCRSGGLDDLGAPLYFLDERPAQRWDWTLIGCERSLQFYRHYYGDEPPRVEMCPRVIAGDRDQLTLLKAACCSFISSGRATSPMCRGVHDLRMVEQALHDLIERVDCNA